MPDAREHDVVVFGATGFTGGLTAEYLAAHGGGARWAIAGRSADKLRRVADGLGVDVPVITADVSDPKSMRAMAASAKCVLTTVGPYIEWGEPLVAACAAEGTAYCDLTGEPEFADLMYVRHHAEASRTGARILHACGFDSIPHDMGVHFTVQQLPEGVPIAIEGFVRAGGSASGGTVASALGIMARVRQGQKVLKERRAMEPHSARRVRGLVKPPRRDKDEGWLLPMPTIDPQVVRQSGLALERYGPDFSYAAFIVAPNAAIAAGMGVGAGALFGAAQVPPLRRLISSKIPQGTGPSAERIAKGWFKLRFRGTGGGQSVVTEVRGGDPGYGDTAKMLAETGLCLALDDLPQTSGSTTTAAACGDALRVRLIAAGQQFEVL
ncbi:MAG: hypothetical protein QOF76_5674 [Solirubrobacteraceae bacterium]|nr:hypothetical protein [Solirubrobacteraceae bacterium]